ncbi:hypothetical protein [Streptomyces sp. NPDC006739]|uniref:hypothetical protein n=1 Tax=Streptomyces sp. NPDC006739 TaxID=3364763 RepID=UPI003680D7C8
MNILNNEWIPDKLNLKDAIIALPISEELDRISTAISLTNGKALCSRVFERDEGLAEVLKPFGVQLLVEVRQLSHPQLLWAQRALTVREDVLYRRQAAQRERLTELLPSSRYEGPDRG